MIIQDSAGETRVSIDNGNLSLEADFGVLNFATESGNAYRFYSSSPIEVGVKAGVLDFSSIASTDKTFIFPNASGTIALAAQGTDVASANNLVLASGVNAVEITGATQINLIANTNRQNGSQITLLFSSNPTVKHAQATSGANTTILLAGATDFVASAGDTLTLMLCEIGGIQAWREISRAVI